MIATAKFMAVVIFFLSELCFFTIFAHKTEYT